jgi:hypothetical protein
VEKGKNFLFSYMFWGRHVAYTYDIRFFKAARSFGGDEDV